jgi:hypothetical protein
MEYPPFSMNLTAGATLQNGKYLIRSVLSQTQFGCTYRATHVYLDQTVILQTLNPELRDRPSFAQWRQHFMISVKQLGKRQPPLPAKIVDCFEEGGMPFLALERLSEQTLPKVEDWLLPLPTTKPSQKAAHALKPDDSSLTSTASQTAPLSSKPEATPPAPPVAKAISQPEKPPSPTQPPTLIQNPTTIQKATAPVELPHFEPILHEASLEAAIAPNTASTSSVSPWQVIPQPKSRKPKRLLPFALLVTAIVGGIAGVSFGLSLRFGQSAAAPASSDPSGNPLTDNGLFGSDQDFPPKDDWPGEGLTETNEISPPPDMPIEEAPAHTPVRRSRSVGNYNPAPSERVPRAPETTSVDEPLPDEPLPDEPLDDPLSADQPPIDTPPLSDSEPLPDANAVSEPAPPPIDFDQVKPIPPAGAEPSQPSGSIKNPESQPPVSSPSATIAPPVLEPGAANP